MQSHWFETHSVQILSQEGSSVEMSQFLLQEPWTPRVQLASLQWSCPSWAWLLNLILSWPQSQTSAKLDPVVLKQCLESVLIPFMPLLLKIFYGLSIFLHSGHWISHDHWIELLEWYFWKSANLFHLVIQSNKHLPFLKPLLLDIPCMLLQVWCLPSSACHIARKI